MNDVNTNFVGPINITNAVLPSMRERRDGTIVFVGSRSAFRTYVPVSLTSSSPFVDCLTYLRAIQGTGEHQIAMR